MITTGIDCNECYTFKPDSADLIVFLTFSGDFDSIPLVIYRDVIGENNIDYIDTAYSTLDNPYYLYSKVNQKYVVKAEYKKGEKTIYAVDRSKIKVKRVTGECDEDCWVVEGGELDAKLKFEFYQ